MYLEDFNYSLPKNLIAKRPSDRRESKILICILIVLVLILCMTQVCICTTKRTLMLLNVHSLSYLLCKTSPQGIGGHQIFITAKLFKVDTIWL